MQSYPSAINISHHGCHVLIYLKMHCKSFGYRTSSTRWSGRTMAEICVQWPIYRDPRLRPDWNKTTAQLSIFTVFQLAPPCVHCRIAFSTVLLPRSLAQELSCFINCCAICESVVGKVMSYCRAACTKIYTNYLRHKHC